jgi:hypothetical protein
LLTVSIDSFGTNISDAQAYYHAWSVDSNEQTRLNIWTKGSGDFRQKGEMDLGQTTAIIP